MFWIDEAQDLFQNDSSFEIENNLKLVKSLMQGDDAVVVVLSGTERLDRLTAEDPQVRRRLSRMSMPVATEATDGRVLAGILADYCRRAGLAPPAQTDLIGRLIHSARGQFGRCIEMILDAIEIALRADQVRLDMLHFAEVFRILEGCPPGKNVFLAPNWRTLRLDADPDQEPAQRPRRKRRAPRG